MPVVETICACDNMSDMESLREHPEISVIVPIYNGEKHLRRCIDSVFANGFDSLELLLIDDGSSDGSLEILREYETAHPGVVRVFAHENMGVARTRNKGIGLARGRYVLFLDQDDWYDADYIKTFYDAIERTGGDVVIGGYRRPDENGRIFFRRELSGKGYFRYIMVEAWAKIHRTEFLRANDIAFFDNDIGEDVAFCVQEANLSDKISYIHYNGYNWYYNRESVSETAYKGFQDDVGLFRFFEKIDSFVFGDDRLEEYVIVKLAFYYLMHSGRDATPEKYAAVYAEIMGWIENKFPNFSKNRFLNTGLPGEPLKVRAAVALLMMIHKLGWIRLFSKLYCHGIVQNHPV